MNSRPPRWGWLVLFVIGVGIHLLFSGWNLLGFLVGFGATLIMVFAPAPRLDPLQRMKWRLTALGALTGVLLGALVLLLVLVGVTLGNGESWGVEDVASAVFLFALVLVPLLLMPRWRRRVAWPRRLLADGAWRSLPAVVDTDEELEHFESYGLRLWEVRGWAVLPDGLRVRFAVSPCPIELYEGIRATRTVWVAGPLEPDEPVVLGLADGAHLTESRFEAKVRDVKRLRARSGSS